MKTVSYIVYSLIWVYSIIWGVYFEYLQKTKILGINPFFLVVLIPSIFVLIYLPLVKDLIRNQLNRTLITFILIYILYQLFVIYPLTLYYYGSLSLDYTKITIKDFLAILFHRQLLIIIPFVYLFLLNFKIINDLNKIVKNISYLTVILVFIGILNYLSGNFIITNTGEPRYLSGVTNVIFAFCFFQNLKLSNFSKNNYFFLLISAFGFILTNHRSAYFIIIFLLIVLMINWHLKVSFVKKFEIVKIFLLILIVVVSAGFYSFELLTDMISRFKSLLFFETDGNILDRIDKNELAFLTFLNNPINGTLHSGIYYPLGVFDEYLKVWQPHNFIFDILASQGIVGMIFIGIISYYIFKVILKVSNLQKSYTEFSVVLFYYLYALANVTFLNGTTIIVLATMTAISMRKLDLLEAKK